MQRRVVSFAAIAAALFLGSAVFAQRAGRLFSAPAVFHGGAAQVDKALGRPRAVTAVSPMDRPGEYREYQRQGAKVSVRFKRGKAVAFVVRLAAPAASAEKAVALVGINVSGKRPNSSTPISKFWRGSLGHRAIKEVSALNLGGTGWDQVTVRDYY